MLASMIAGTRLTKRRRLSGRTTEPQQEPRDGYQRLAVVVIAQALTDAQLGDWGALLWLLSDNCQMYTEWIGTDYNRIKQAANIIRGKLIAGAQEKD